MPAPDPARRQRRLAEDLADHGFPIRDPRTWPPRLLAEVDHALHPAVHERRVASFGAVVGPTVAPEGWEAGTGLSVTRRRLGAVDGPELRRYADGLAAFVVVGAGDPDELVVFDRPAGSERDLTVLADVTGGWLVQRHPSGRVRVVGEEGVLRWDGIDWQHEPPLDGWAVAAVDGTAVPAEVAAEVLSFAVHDLGAGHIGAVLVLRPGGVAPAGSAQLRERTAPALDVRCPSDLAPLRHVLTQVDGAAVLDEAGVLRQLGVRLVPSPTAEAGVDAFRGMRHTSARRYSHDDPEAVVVVVSEDGPVSVLRAGDLVGRPRR